MLQTFAQQHMPMPQTEYMLRMTSPITGIQRTRGASADRHQLQDLAYGAVRWCSFRQCATKRRRT